MAKRQSPAYQFDIYGHSIYGRIMGQDYNFTAVLILINVGQATVDGRVERDFQSNMYNMKSLYGAFRGDPRGLRY